MQNKELDIRIDRWIADNKEQIIKDIVDIVAINSVSCEDASDGYPFGKECAEVLELMLKKAQGYGFITKNGGNYYGIASIDNKKPYIAMIGHLDIVPAGEGWSYDPFKATVENGWIIGRGSSDNKGPCVCALHTLRAVKDLGIELKYGLSCVFGVNEEAGMKDMEHFVKHEEQPVFAFSPDTDFPVCNGEKGILQLDMVSKPLDGKIADIKGGLVTNMVAGKASVWLKGCSANGLSLPEGFEAQPDGGLLKITANGIAMHAAKPEGSRNAIWMLSGWLSQSGLVTPEEAVVMASIHRLTSDNYGRALGIEYKDELSGHTTCIAGLISKSEAGAVVLNLNCRFSVSKDMELLKKQFYAAAEREAFTIKDYNCHSPSFVDPEYPAVKILNGVFNEITGQDLKPYVMGGGTYARKLKNAVAFGPSFPGTVKPFPGGRGDAHEIDECESIENTLKAIKIFIHSVIGLNEAEL